MGDEGPKTKPRTGGRTSPWMPSLRKRGEKLLHGKYLVSLVIILTIIDCSLVIAELILDLYSVKKTLLLTEGQTFKFIKSIRSRYPEQLRPNDTVASLYDRVADSTILWNTSKDLDLYSNAGSPHTNTPLSSTIGMPLPFKSRTVSEINKQHAKWNSNSKTVIVKNENNSTSSSTHHHRRSRSSSRSNTPNEVINDFQHNERRSKSNLHLLLNKLVRRIRRYLYTDIKHDDQQLTKDFTRTSNIALQDESTTDSSIFQDERTITYDISQDDNTITYDIAQEKDDNTINYDIAQEDKTITDDSVQDGSTVTSSIIKKDNTFIEDDNDRNKDAIRQRDELIILHKTLSDILTMQQNGSKDFEYSNINTAALHDDVVNGNLRFKSTMLSDHNDASNGGSLSSSNDVKKESSYFKDISPYASKKSVVDGTSSDIKDGKEIPTKGNRRKRNSDDYEDHMRKELHHSAEMEIAHKLHYASVGVSSILVIEVTLKIICAGSHFLKRKIQVFDAIVIVTSVIVDLIFIKGLPEFAVDDSIFVLALLLPWRVIRVVNSLVMAVIDHEQVKLRLLYSRKKKLDKTVESLRNEIDEIKGTLQEIRAFCIKEGIEATRIDGMLGKFAPRRRKDSKFYTLVKLVMSTASINNNDNDSVSSSSIENDLRHYSNKDSVMNLAASSRGTMTSLKQYLSVPFSNGDSHYLSDADSLAGDHPGLSPSIYITSPVSDDGRGIMSFCDVDMEGNDVDMAYLDPNRRSEERDKVATIAITDTSTNINTMNGVSFYVGSQTSLDVGHSQENLAVQENDNSHNESSRGSNLSGVTVESNSNTTSDANKNFPSRQFRLFLTVPDCEESVSSGSNLPTTNLNSSNNNNANEPIDVTNATTSLTLLPQDSTKQDMKRSASENANITLGFTPYEGKFSHGLVGSPTPVRRLPEVRTKRKIYSRSRSESEDNDILMHTKRDRHGRFRRNSGDPQAFPRIQVQEPQRARSHSPSPMMLLSVPGNNTFRNDITSRSMNDVSMTDNMYANNPGDGIILRRSCLSLNSEGRKRRDKSPNRVSFKVS